MATKTETIVAKRLGRQCYEWAQSKWGHGWSLLSKEQQEGAMAIEIVWLCLMQPEDSHSKNVAKAAYEFFQSKNG